MSGGSLRIRDMELGRFQVAAIPTSPCAGSECAYAARPRPGFGAAPPAHRGGCSPRGSRSYRNVDLEWARLDAARTDGKTWRRRLCSLMGRRRRRRCLGVRGCDPFSGGTAGGRRLVVDGHPILKSVGTPVQLLPCATVEGGQQRTDLDSGGDQNTYLARSLRQADGYSSAQELPGDPGERKHWHGSVPPDERATGRTLDRVLTVRVTCARRALAVIQRRWIDVRIRHGLLI